AFASQPAIADTTFECIEVGNSYATVAFSDTGLKTEPRLQVGSTRTRYLAANFRSIWRVY
ncbi:MAG: hypothetical protein ACP5D7_22370, partial [Limnospira sp.]